MASIFILGFLLSTVLKALFPKQFYKKVKYSYLRKQYLLTKSECDFLSLLESAFDDMFYIFPQVHLPSFLERKIKGQNWKAAFRHIDEKSVDFVFCDKISLKPRLAVELDDATHAQFSRKERDIEVERILKGAGMPLVRIDATMNNKFDDIRNNILEALKL